MKLLLLGAGFSRNWGGWLASELVGELCGRLQDRSHILEMLQVDRNFEAVLGQRRQAALEPDNAQAKEDVRLLEKAIQETFADMNRAIAERDSLEFSPEKKFSIARFLHQFDAIFTLNQDLLLELLYDCEYSLFTGFDRRWSGCEFPGVRMTGDWRATPKERRISMTMAVSDEPTRNTDNQPIYKLHGSSHWRTNDGNSMMVVGTGKEGAISQNKLLRAYWEEFERHLSQPRARIMVIGYSFSDAHINEALLRAAERLKMYIVDPSGLDAFRGHRDTLNNGRNPFSKVTVMGVSTRPLTATFGGRDALSFGSFDRFLREEE